MLEQQNQCYKSGIESRETLQKKLFLSNKYPSMMEGIARLFDISSISEHYSGYLKEGDVIIDSRSLFCDWSFVGDYLKEAIEKEKYEQERIAKKEGNTAE